MCVLSLLSWEGKQRALTATSPDVDIKYIGGKDPEMVFRDESGTEVKVGSLPWLHRSHYVLPWWPHSLDGNVHALCECKCNYTCKCTS